MRLFGAIKNLAKKMVGKTVLDEATAEELEEALIEADVAYETVERMLKQVENSRAHQDGIQAGLREALVEALSTQQSSALNLPGPVPSVIFVTGVNGVGKTTSIAKLGYMLNKQGKSVLLAAADTFRAAAIDQLGIWAERLGVQIVKHAPGADPAAVVFDAVSAAKARSIDVVIVDTAGRLHTKSNLMEELKKICRAVEKANGRGPDESLLVLDSTTGQNAVAQAKEFMAAVPVTGLILAKMDSSARGGVIISIKEQLGLPVKLIGTGEQLADMEVFDPEQFVNSLFEEEAASEPVSSG